MKPRPAPPERIPTTLPTRPGKRVLVIDGLRAIRIDSFSPSQLNAWLGEIFITGHRRCLRPNGFFTNGFFTFPRRASTHPALSKPARFTLLRSESGK